MRKNIKQKTIVILGPTSSGKSDVAIKLAKKFDGEVISADSRQVYKNMDLGTGKVVGRWLKKEKRNVFLSDGVPHHLIDFRSPRGDYNVAQFQKDCKELIRELANRGKLPIVCGGTGFWISAIVNDFKLPKVKPDPALRRKLEKQTAHKLFATLKKADQQRASAIDPKNKHRLIRAIEICKYIGKVPTPSLQQKATSNAFLQIGIDWPQEKLDKKIKKRLDSRWRMGMIKEVRKLKKSYGLSWKKIQSFGLAYYWIPLFIQGRITKEELYERVFKAERKYAKRQRAWFKRDKRIIWENDQRKIKKIARLFLENK